MKLQDHFRNRDLSAQLLDEISRSLDGPLRIMEVCGTHTVSIFRQGIRSLLPASLTLLSGPGCPVCVTPASHIDACVAAALLPQVIVATFGDLIRVPGSRLSLAGARSQGARVELVYSPLDALLLAQKQPQDTIVFPAIGFETTTPAIAATLVEAERLGLRNFFIIAAGKTMPGALMSLLADPALKLDGLLCPGHVSAIIGADAYLPLVQTHHLGCAVAGFEPADILAGILSLIRQKRTAQVRVDNCYTRAVTAQGNQRAQALMREVFEPCDSPWRGLGSIAASGLALRKPYQRYDALEQFAIPLIESPEPTGCRCGEILKGRLTPPQCPLFGKACIPGHPIGPCMVSSEGSCSAYFRYGG